MKRKIKIGFWVTAFVAVVGFTAIILNDLRIQKIEEETWRILRETVISVDFEGIPYEEVIRRIKAQAMEVNPEFQKIEFEWNLSSELRSTSISIELAHCPVSELLNEIRPTFKTRYLSIDERAIRFDESRRPHSVTEKIEWWYFGIEQRIRRLFGANDPSDPFSGF